MDRDERNRRGGRRLLLLALGMFGFGFAMVPLYGLVCEVTGIQSLGSALGPARIDTAAAPGRTVRVKFDTTVNGNLPWAFRPQVASMEVPVGTMQRTVFEAENRSGRAVTGQAIPAVTPWQANPWFSKAECFCFTRQTLAAGERKEMPLAFMVSPELPADIDTLTLSYTFMNADAL